LQPQAVRHGRKSLRTVSAIAHDAPRKAVAQFEALQADAPEPTSHGNIVAKSNIATEAIFTTSGNLNEAVEVVAHVLQRPELRPILKSLGYSQASDTDRMMMT